MRFVKSKDLKKFFTKNEDKIVLIIGIFLIALISFGAGRLTTIKQPKEPIKIEDYGLASLQAFSNTEEGENIKEPEKKDGSTSLTTEGMFVGSINSNKYHLPDCTWAKRINEENLIWFESAEDAKSKGYIPANCLKRE